MPSRNRTDYAHRCAMKSTASHSSATLTTRIINPLLSSVSDTFEGMLDSEVQRGALELCELQSPLYDLSAVILVTGRAKGMFCLSFATETALNLTERFLGVRPNRIDDDVLDAVGEMANMISGATKSKLNISLNIGLPKIVRGNSSDIHFPEESRPMRLHYSSDLGPFCIDFGFVHRTI